MEVLCFFAGIAFYYLKSLYPLYLLFGLCFFRPRPLFFIWFISGCLWSQVHEYFVADEGMPSIKIMSHATIEGFVTSIPLQKQDQLQFQFIAERINDKPTKTNLILYCFEQCPKVLENHHYQLQAKLKRPANLENPGRFDYVGWLESRHIRWVGTIRPHTLKPQDKQPIKDPLLTIRAYFASKIEALIQNKDILGVIEALTIGITHHIHKDQWDLFRKTGTTHLIDISGEHIALIAGLSYGFFKWIWKHLGELCLKYPAPKIASLFAILMSFLYSLIAGFAVPTQRSFITCCLMLICHLGRKRFGVWQSWRYAMLFVLVLEPHSVFMLGFYFSFIAVAILILVNQRVRGRKLRKMAAMQLACLFGLMPLSLYWFSYASMNGLMANLLAIPWVSFLIVPLALIITFISPWVVIPGSVFVLNTLTEWLLSCLKLIDSFDAFNFNFTFTQAIQPIALMGVLAILFFFPVSRVIPPTVIMAIACFFPQYEKIKRGYAKIDVLDVGQGLAIIARTSNHVLVYDTGMKFYRGGDIGKAVITPYLRRLGIKQLDKIVISHSDLDHRGGLTSLEEKFPIQELIVDDPLFYKRGRSCHRYHDWTWDDVVFRFFPIIPFLKGKNNHSCILQISTAGGKILLSGDIEEVAERYLIQTYGNLLASTAMLVPHHGSKTSSSLAYIKQIAPRFAFASYGFDNRYHFPHQQATHHYAVLNIPLYSTAEYGMIQLNLGPNTPFPLCYKTPCQASSYLFRKIAHLFRPS